MQQEVSLRPIRDDDLEFLYRVYASTRLEELAIVPWSEAEKTVFLRQQCHAQHTYYQSVFSGASYQVVLRAGEPIGRLYIDRRADHICIIDIALLPEFRGSGIGTMLLERVCEEADAAGKPVRIHVEVNNPARTLYDRLCFLEQGSQDGIYLLMERPVGGRLAIVSTERA